MTRIESEKTDPSTGTSKQRRRRLPRTERARTDGGAEPRYAVGLMSGTSLDGIDAACCAITCTAEDEAFPYEIRVESFITEPYPTALRTRLVELCDDETGRVDEVCRLDFALGSLFARAAERAREAAGVSTDDLDVIGSHGQTVWHIGRPETLPGSDDRLRSTLQIGNSDVIARRTSTRTVSDFRTADVAAHGHGAPLAPYLDATEVVDENRSRVLQNIGGIGNCTILPPTADRDEIRAFDTGPGNMVIDAIVEILTDGEQTYDVDGKIAAGGTADTGLVDEFLEDPYFEERPPKTTGREDFGHEFARRFIRAGRKRGLDEDDLVASATAFTVESIGGSYDRFAEQYPDEVYVSGGGAQNPTLMAMLAERVDCPVDSLSALGIDPDEKEAALFALLAIARVDGAPNNVPGATGADEPVVMGKVTLP